MKSPIVDVHAHLFNADDVPVKGFLTQAYGVPGLIAEIVDAIVQGLAPDDRLSFEVLEGHEPTDEEVDYALEACLRENAQLERRVESRIEAGLGSIWRHVKWALTVMTRSRLELAHRLTKTYPEVDLFIPLMVDLDLWLNDSAETTAHERVERFMDPLIERFAGRIHPFVAFDPERQRRHGDALELVRDALENRGFIGVKLYPPAGFSASGNDAPGLDTALEQLYAFCEAEEVPIAAHCNDSGAQAAPGRGRLSHPKYWQPVLAAHPNLRLNLAHFGGEDDLARNADRSWAFEIAEMMSRYRNVYGDTGHHSIVHNRQIRERFFERLHELYRRHPAARERFLFGTDWHMIVREQDYRDYLGRYREFYVEQFGEGECEGFLGGNAVEFLGLRQGGGNRSRLTDYYGRRGIAPPSWFTDLA